MLKFKDLPKEIQKAMLDEQVRAKLTYDNIPVKFRIKRFEIERNDALIETIQQRVILCREYIESEWKKLF